MKTNDYVKYLTQTVVKYIDQPKEDRKRVKLAKKEEKEPFLVKWFGILPYLFYYNKRKKKR
ncbi:YqzE family protein [Neobacillus sp. D3-1R]|uniref:YqzE family protein n=1 Tax=Neobacillus sp. D3-1R TaxID=3445778 RepID=UPI003FA0B34A